MKKFCLSAAIIAAVTLAFGPSHAAERQATYIASGLLTTGAVTSSTPPTPDTIFPANGKIPSFIEVDDAAGLTGFSVDVCQDTAGAGDPADGNCGPGDAAFSYCSTGQKVAIPTGRGFDGSHETAVFVNPDNLTALVPCSAEGNTLAGTIKLTTP